MVQSSSDAELLTILGVRHYANIFIDNESSGKPKFVG